MATNAEFEQSILHNMSALLKLTPENVDVLAEINSELARVDDILTGVVELAEADELE
jgi:hypothetical protein